MGTSLTDRFQRNIENLKKKFSSKAVILMYHRVIIKDLDPWSLCVSPQHFGEHLEVLSRHATPMSLRDLALAHKEGTVPDRAVAVTFDDGYADNLYNAKPLLEQYKIPATVFVVSKAIGRKRMFWWDELEDLLLRPGILPETLKLNISNETFCWTLGESADYSEDDCRRDHGWTVGLQEYPSPRHSLFHALHQLLQPLSDIELRRVMDELLAWSGKKANLLSLNRTLSLNELIMLKQGELIEIGAHTATHPMLSTLPKNHQQDEIVQGKTKIEEHLGQQVNLLAYPFGNYSTETRAIVKKSGFLGACTIEKGCVWYGSDRHLLPRITARDWGGKKFLRQLNRIVN